MSNAIGSSRESNRHLGSDTCARYRKVMSLTLHFIINVKITKIKSLVYGREVLLPFLKQVNKVRIHSKSNLAALPVTQGHCCCVLCCDNSAVLQCFTLKHCMQKRYH